MIRKLFITAIALMFIFPVMADVSSAQVRFFDEPPFEHYKVYPGDSFWFIGQRYNVDYRKLMRLNPEIDPYNLQVGEVIRLKESAEHHSQFEDQVVQLVNRERRNRGLQPLQHRADLKGVAHRKAEDMIHSNYFSHNSPNYGSPFDMMRTYGISYQAAAENIAKGQTTPEQVMNSWMNSSGHRQNILNGQFDTIGVGFYRGAWVQLFIRAR